MKQPAGQPDAAQMLQALPTRNLSAMSQRNAQGDLVLRVPLERRWFMKPPLSLILPLRSERAVALDKLGEEVWQACDGRRDAEKIIEAFAQRHHLRFHEARLAVMQFLRDLTRRGLVVMVVPGTGRQDA